MSLHLGHVGGRGWSRDHTPPCCRQAGFPVRPSIRCSTWWPACSARWRARSRAIFARLLGFSACGGFPCSRRGRFERPLVFDICPPVSGLVSYETKSTLQRLIGRVKYNRYSSRVTSSRGSLVESILKLSRPSTCPLSVSTLQRHFPSE